MQAYISLVSTLLPPPLAARRLTIEVADDVRHRGVDPAPLGKLLPLKGDSWVHDQRLGAGRDLRLEWFRADEIILTIKSKKSSFPGHFVNISLPICLFMTNPHSTCFRIICSPVCLFACGTSYPLPVYTCGCDYLVRAPIYLLIIRIVHPSRDYQIQIWHTYFGSQPHHIALEETWGHLGVMMVLPQQPLRLQRVVWS